MLLESTTRVWLEMGEKEECNMEEFNMKEV